MEGKNAWKEIQEKIELIEKKKNLVEEKISSLEKEIDELKNLEFMIIEDADEKGFLKISVRDFERTLQKLDPEHLPVKLSIVYDDAESKTTLKFDTPENLRDAKNYEGSTDHKAGKITLCINSMPYNLLKKCYLPKSCEQEENPTVEDLIMCFWPKTVLGNKKLIAIFAEAEKDRAQNTELSDGGKQ